MQTELLIVLAELLQKQDEGLTEPSCCCHHHFRELNSALDDAVVQCLVLSPHSKCFCI